MNQKYIAMLKKITLFTHFRFLSITCNLKTPDVPPPIRLNIQIIPPSTCILHFTSPLLCLLCSHTLPWTLHHPYLHSPLSESLFLHLLTPHSGYQPLLHPFLHLFLRFFSSVPLLFCPSPLKPQLSFFSLHCFVIVILSINQFVFPYLPR